VIVLMLLLPSLCLADEYVSFYGTETTCGDVSRSPKEWNNALHSYISGFVSGSNFRASRNTSNYAAEDLVLWVSNYCKENPLDLLVQAVVALDSDLDKRVGK
jgi:hypothetical protein